MERNKIKSKNKILVIFVVIFYGVLEVLSEGIYSKSGISILMILGGILLTIIPNTEESFLNGTQIFGILIAIFGGVIFYKKVKEKLNKKNVE
ncbi:hypothetical protein C1T31_12005 [Hanstruepera neustonica]|uniref:Uncharacterized protein n=1 Tax=Hanstruepera neustonica TaxID=1445657 RepID=A0A2K1DWX7_9FLAO|nr:hypothetical protein [Hanstruepera neustonica]PNQ72503.1 hypothetical protein C1T31_12005 [Hanstruepera neustonica]